MALPRRKLFRRGDTFVAVRRIPIGGGLCIEPGEDISDRYQLWRLKSWYRRGLIGVRGDDWTRWALEKIGARLAREAERAEHEDETRTAMQDSISSALEPEPEEADRGDEE